MEQARTPIKLADLAFWAGLFAALSVAGAAAIRAPWLGGGWGAGLIPWVAAGGAAWACRRWGVLPSRGIGVAVALALLGLMLAGR